MQNLSEKEQNAIEEFKSRMKDVPISAVLVDDPSLYYRFLKARDFNVDKAESMLRKHIIWRKVNQADTILETFKPKEVFVKYLEPNLIGFDKNGNIVKYSAAGKINSSEVMKCFKMNDYMKHWIWFSEKNSSLIKQRAKITGKNVFLSIIMDLDGLEFANATSKTIPSYYVFIYTIVKAVMSNATLNKLHIFGRNGWKEKLLEVIDPDVLPVFLGGKRIGLDGDPYCKCFISFTRELFKSYYISDEERCFKMPTEVNTIILRPKERKEIFAYVKESGSSIEWKFMVKNKNIGFGLYFEESDEETKEIIPMYEYSTSDGTKEDSYTCVFTGKYVIIFDNSNSIFSTKEILYTVSVIKPKAENA